MFIKSKDMTMDERRARISELVEKFKKEEAFYTSKDFVESEVRSKFIDPFLECLKWDVKNEKKVMDIIFFNKGMYLFSPILVIFSILKLIDLIKTLRKNKP